MVRRVLRDGYPYTLTVTNGTLVSTFQSGLINGGPSVLIYGLFLSWLGSLAVCASLAEMASMWVIPRK